MSERNNVSEKLISLIKDILDYDEEIHPEDSLVDDYGINSIESLKLIARIENIWGIEITGEMLFNIDTVQDMIDVVYENLQ